MWCLNVLAKARHVPECLVRIFKLLNPVLLIVNVNVFHFSQFCPFERPQDRPGGLLGLAAQSCGQLCGPV